MAVSGLIKGLGKGLDELEASFKGLSDAPTPPKSALDELEASFPAGKAADEEPLPLPDVEDIELDEFMAELDQIGKPPATATPPADDFDAVMADLDAMAAELKAEESELGKIMGSFDFEKGTLPTDEQFGDLKKILDKQKQDAPDYVEDPELSPTVNAYLKNYSENSSEFGLVKKHKMEQIKKISQDPGMKANLADIDNMDIPAAEKEGLKHAELDIAYVNSFEEIDLDEFAITPDRPNLPEGSTFDTLIGSSGPEWVYERPVEELEALSLMTFVRGPYFPHIAKDLGIKNYSGPVIEGFEPLISKAEFDAMDPLDISAINFYTKAGDSPMNEALREGKYDPDTALGKAIDATQTALQRLPSYKPRKVEEQVVHRVIRGREVNSIFGEMQVGETFKEDAFMSTSIKPNFSKSPDGEYKFNVGGEGVFFVIRPKHTGSRAHAIEDLSEFKTAEREVLFEHGTEFKIVERDHIESEATTFGGKTIPVDSYILYVEEL